MWEKFKIKILKQNEEKELVFGQCLNCSQKAVLGSPETKIFLCHQCGYFGMDGGHLSKPCPVVSHQEQKLHERSMKWLQGMGLFQEGVPTSMAGRFGTGVHYYPATRAWEASLKLFDRDPQGTIQNVIGLRKNLEFHGINGINGLLGDVQGPVLVLVNHPLDYLAAVSAGIQGVACPTTKLTMDFGESQMAFMGELEGKMGQINKIILAFPQGPEKTELETEMARRLGKEKCHYINWDIPEIVDVEFCNIPRPLKAVQVKGAAYLQECLEQAVPFPINGLYELSDVDEKLEALYELGFGKGLQTGWPSLDEFYTVIPGQWTVVTGIPGHGKSNFLDALLINLAKKYGWQFGLFSPENQPIERHFASLMEKYTQTPFISHGTTPRMTVEEKNKAKKFINKHFKAILPTDDMNWSIDGILELGRKLVFRHGIRGLVVDPWNELDHTRDRGMTETEHISSSLTKIRRFARVHDCHVWIVAHPTKLQKDGDGQYPIPTLYDISGGAHWRNKTDNGLVIFRNVGKIDEDVADIHVQKVRFKEVGKVGMVSLRADRGTNCYIDDVDQAQRRKSLQSPEPIQTDNIRIGQPRDYHKKNVGDDF